MTVVDSSALIAILFEEPEKQAFQTIITGGERCIMSAVNVRETACVLRVRHGLADVGKLWQLKTMAEIIDAKTILLPYYADTLCRARRSREVRR